VPPGVDAEESPARWAPRRETTMWCARTPRGRAIGSPGRRANRNGLLSDVAVGPVSAV